VIIISAEYFDKRGSILDTGMDAFCSPQRAPRI